MLLALVISQSLVHAADGTHGHVEVTATTRGVMLKDGAWLAATESFINHPDWLPANEQAARYTAEFGVEYYAAPASVLMFAASEDAEVRIEVSGQWRDRGDGKPDVLPIDVKSLRVTGASMMGAPPMPRTTSIQQPISFSVRVKKDTPVYLEIVALRNPPSDLKPAPIQETRAHKLAGLLQRGVNLSNWLEVPPDEDWGDNSCHAEDMRQISLQGFDHIRLPVGWHHYTGRGPQYRIGETIFQAVDRVVKQASEAGLAVIINIHHFEEFTTNPQAEEARLIAIWDQLAKRYASQPESMFFEILNEPKDNATTEVMNEVWPKVLSVIRPSNPNRGVLVGPGDFNAISSLNQLRLPEHDRNLIVSVHSYEPYVFTHQRTEWSIPAVKNIEPIRFPGPPQKAIRIPVGADDWIQNFVRPYNQVNDSRFNPSGPLTVERLFELASGWSKFHGRPVHLGEFGAYTTVDSKSRAAYYECVRKQAESKGIGWCMWDWKSGFAYWDRNAKRADPVMRHAMFEN